MTPEKLQTLREKTLEYFAQYRPKAEDLLHATLIVSSDAFAEEGCTLGYYDFREWVIDNFGRFPMVGSRLANSFTKARREVL